MSALDTYDVAKPDRRDFWAEAVSRIFARLEVLPAEGQEIDCRLRWRDIGRARMTFASGSPQSVCRTSSAIASDQAANIILMFQEKGYATLLHRGRCVELRPGTMVAMDTRSPYRLSFPNRFEQHVLRVPADVLGVHAEDTEPLTATALQPSFASRLLAAGFSALEQADPGDALELPLLDLTRLALWSGMPALQSRTMADRLRQAQGYIHAHLGMADLSAQKVANELGISLRMLQKIFATAGEQPGAYILNQRLDRVGEILGRPEHAARSIGQVAAALGFHDPSHFSRVFRDRFGMSARNWRKLRLERAH